MSLMPASRLMRDSVRSPMVPTNATRTPATRPHHHWAPSRCSPRHPTPIAARHEPAKPSHDFFGDRRGAMGWRPMAIPAAQPPVSEAITIAS